MKKAKAESERVCTSSVTQFQNNPAHMLKIQNAFGISTTRHANILSHNGIVTTALGPNLIQWDLTKKEQIFSKQICRDMITCIRQDQARNRLCITSHAGEVVLVDVQHWNILSQLQVGGKILHCHWSLDGDYIVTTSIFNHTVSVIEVTTNSTLRLVETLHGEYEFAEMTAEGHHLILAPTRQKEAQSSSIEVYDWKEKKVLSQISLEGKRQVSIMASNQKGYLAVALARQVYLLKATQHSIQIDSSFDAQGSGIMKSILLTDDNRIVCPSDNRKITIWKNGTLETTVYGTLGTMYGLTWNWDDCNAGQLLVCTDNGFDIIDTNQTITEPPPEEELVDSLAYHKISCCGADLNGGKCVVGDLGGNAFIWEKGTAPSARVHFPSGIRAVLWCDSNTAFLSCLNGKVYLWKIQDSHVEPQCVYASPPNNHVICLEWVHDQVGKTMVIGDSQGKAHILDWADGQFKERHSWLAHPRIEEGKSSRNAEIWSITCSPENKFIATASEDQTTRIWEFGTAKEISVLRGHTAAVTGVEWNISSVVGEVLLTCSDDKTIRMYSPDLSLVHIFNATHIPEWYTLTYLNIEIGGDLFAVSTQNGFVFIFRLSDKQLILADKIHQGSIEGLKWREGKILTCASDCCVIVSELQTLKSHL